MHKNIIPNDMLELSTVIIFVQHHFTEEILVGFELQA